MTTEKPNRAALNPDLNRGIGGESRTLDRRTIQIGRIVPAIVVAILRWVASAFDAIDFDPLARHRYYVIGAIVVLAVAVLWRFTIVVAVATFIGHLGSQLAFPAPTRSFSSSRATGPSGRMVRSPRSASVSTLQPVLRFLRNVPSRWRIAGAVVMAGAAGVALRNPVHTT
ncbi:hypothetical protein ACFX1X_004630 [Malus domestica]|uniref:Uncharacterized protein n=1 Tax=Malus domestica TaxID=3750 RepID=A0A498IZC5_MALDO|nr:hypothetical protein DVH24_022156 [Malus domestica]